MKHRLPKDLTNSIMGHEPDKDETSHTYSNEYKIEELYIGICSLELRDYFKEDFVCHIHILTIKATICIICSKK